jgi:hypothetical protein
VRTVQGDRHRKDRDRERERDRHNAKYGLSERDHALGKDAKALASSRSRDHGLIRGKESYPVGERFQDPGMGARKAARNVTTKDENKANEGDSSDSSRHDRGAAPPIHRNVPAQSRAPTVRCLVF